MKNHLILLFVVLTVFSVKAQYGCPSSIDFSPAHRVYRANKYKVELILDNPSFNLNGFEIEITKPDMAKWAIFDNTNPQNKYFTAAGYGKNILAQWSGKSDDEREAGLSQHSVILSQIHNSNLYILEMLTTAECRYFPYTSYQEIAVGKFAIDLSDCPDGTYLFQVNPIYYNFYYGDGSEESVSLSPNFYPEILIYKYGEYAGDHDFRYDAITTVDGEKQVASVRYYNLAGVESAEPSKGVSIRVTTYSDGTRSTEKIMR